jgi:hypothetical protein
MYICPWFAMDLFLHCNGASERLFNNSYKQKEVAHIGMLQPLLTVRDVFSKTIFFYLNTYYRAIHTLPRHAGFNPPRIYL